MAAIVTRAGKGSPLTFSEVDANFVNLNTNKLEAPNGVISDNIKIASTDAVEPAIEVTQATSNVGLKLTKGSAEIVEGGLSVNIPQGVGPDIQVGNDSVPVGRHSINITSVAGTTGGSTVVFKNSAATHKIGHGSIYFPSDPNSLLIEMENGTNMRWLVGASELLRLLANGNFGVGNTLIPTSKLHVEGPIALSPPTQVNAVNYTLSNDNSSFVFNTTNCTVTLPTPSSARGRILYMKNTSANSVVSASSNVKPLGSDVAGTAILAATAGKFAMLQSDGAHWIIMMAN